MAQGITAEAWSEVHTWIKIPPLLFVIQFEINIVSFPGNRRFTLVCESATQPLIKKFSERAEPDSRPVDRSNRKGGAEARRRSAATARGIPSAECVIVNSVYLIFCMRQLFDLCSSRKRTWMLLPRRLFVSEHHM